MSQPTTALGGESNFSYRNSSERKTLLIILVIMLGLAPLCAAFADSRREGEEGGGAPHEDTDGDGVLDHNDCAPLDPSILNVTLAFADADHDTIADSAAAAPVSCGGGFPSGYTLDPNYSDNCAEVANSDQSDLDHDAIGDLCDSDQDNDGVLNEADCAPADAALSVAIIFSDPDNDGVRNNTTGLAGCYAPALIPGGFVAALNGPDNCATIANAEQTDSNGNGIGDLCEAALRPSNFCSISGHGLSALPLITQSKRETRLALLDGSGQQLASIGYAGKDLLAVGNFYKGTDSNPGLASFGILDLVRRGRIESADGIVQGPFAQVKRASGAACHFEPGAMASFASVQRKAILLQKPDGSVKTLALMKGQRPLKLSCADLDRDGKDELLVLAAKGRVPASKNGLMRAKLSVLSPTGSVLSTWSQKIAAQRRNPILSAADVNNDGQGEICVLSSLGKAKTKPSKVTCSSSGNRFQLSIPGQVLDLAGGKFETQDGPDELAVLIKEPRGAAVQLKLQTLSSGLKELKIPAALGWSSKQLKKTRFANCR